MCVYVMCVCAVICNVDNILAHVTARPRKNLMTLVFVHKSVVLDSPLCCINGCTKYTTIDHIYLM